jgi:hypothetical protein
VTEQCRQMSIPRSTSHHTPWGETPLNLALTLRVEEQFL